MGGGEFPDGDAEAGHVLGCDDDGKRERFGGGEELVGGGDHGGELVDRVAEAFLDVANAG